MHGTPSINSLAKATAMRSTRPLIAVLDSGVGGFPYADWINRRRRGGSIIYLADTAGFPYGNCSADELVKLVAGRVGTLVDQFDPDLFLIACNTASVVALDRLRDEFNPPFVGVVPAVKPAALKSRNRRIGLIATKGTVVHGYTDRLIRDYAADCAVERFDGQELVDFVEHDFLSASPTERLAAVAPAARFFRERGVDSLVLGCTHFIHLIDEFRQALGSPIEIIDSVSGVGRQVLRQLEHGGFTETGEKNFSIYTSAHPVGSGYEDFSRLYGAEYRGVLPCP